MPVSEPPTQAQLSSLATTLEDLRARLSGYLDALSVDTEASAQAVDLADVERSLQAAARKLRKVAGPGSEHADGAL